MAEVPVTAGSDEQVIDVSPGATPPMPTTTPEAPDAAPGRPSLAEVTHPLHGEWMTPRRRFLSALFRGHVDKVPACTLSSVVTVEMMDLVDAPFPEAHLDAERMARLAATAHDVMGLDTIMPVFHSQLESDALGGDTDWAEKDNWPSPSKFVISEPEQVTIPPDYLERPTMKAVRGAIRLLRHRYPDVAIVGKVYGPWSVAYQMVGIESFLMDTILDPDKVRRYLDAFLPACIRSAIAQFEAGADAIMWADHTTGDLCSAVTYRDFLLEMHQQVSQTIGGPSVFHCCGKTIDRVHLFASAGWDCFHFESQVDARAARAAAGERMALFGNLNNPTLLYRGTYEDVYRTCWELLDAGVDGLAPEGSVPLTTKVDRLRAIADAARDWSRLRRGDGQFVVRPGPDERTHLDDGLLAERVAERVPESERSVVVG
jgi:[methyl-Co(III) methanol-specific corrinoid protein]:coenzyme M methyltransferase